MYGLPKVHKEGTPMRPIVSNINCPTYKLAKHLSKIINPLTGQSESYIKNSFEFTTKIKEIDVDKDDKMISFDVVNLFTKVPVNETLELLFKKLSEDETLSERTNIPIQEICNLTEMCIKNTYFQFEEQFYEQIEGMAMGSPLSPVLANIFMEDFEKEVLKTTTLKPRLWLRYVDDTFVLWPHRLEDIEVFHQHLNKRNKSIKFTIEHERDNKLAFLDVMVERKGNHFKTKVYKKKTHTDRYIHFNSHHHHRVHTGTIKCIKNRAKTICNEEYLEQELGNISEVFQKNGYPKRLVQKILTTDDRNKGKVNNGEEEKKTLIIPYVKGISEKIEKVGKKLNLRVVFKYYNSIKKNLMHMKHQVNYENKKGVVYKIPCSQCQQSYIGETGRTLAKRKKSINMRLKQKI